MRGCRHARAAIEREQDGRLSLEGQFRLEEHLARCPRCVERRRRGRALEEALERLPEAPVERLDLQVALERIGARIDALPGSAPAERRSRRLAAAAAVLLAGVGVAIWLAYPGGSHTPEQAPIAALGQESVGPPEAAVGVGASDESPPQQSPEIAAAPGEELDRERLDLARYEVSAWLVSAFEGLSSGAPRQQTLERAERFERDAAELVASGWPVVRIAEGLLDGPLDAASAAARYLGLRGDALSLRKLELCLGRDGLAPHALRALADAGESGAPFLARALDHPEQAELALEGLVSIGGEPAARAVAGALDRAVSAPWATGLGVQPARLLETLSGLGEAGVIEVLGLFDRRLIAEAELAAALNAAPGAEALLGRLCRERTAAPRPETLLFAIELLQPPDGLALLAEYLGERSLRREALQVLASYRADAALELLLDLYLERRLDPHELDGALVVLIAADAERALRVAERALDGDPGLERAAELLGLLVGSECPAAVPAILHLARSPRLSDEERLLAILAVGEFGRAEHVPLLLDSLKNTPRRAKRLAAAHLLAVHALDDVSDALAALGPIPSRTEVRIRAQLGEAEQRRGASVSLLKLARELEPYLTHEDPQSRRLLQ